MDAILSINPKYVAPIKQGIKRYEFRKVIFRKAIDRVYIYATYPIQRIVGYFKAGKIIKDNPLNLWNALSQQSGIEEGDFISYFGDNQIGFAIELKDPIFFKTPIDPKDFISNFIPPQSFRYVNSNIFKNF